MLKNIKHFLVGNIYPLLLFFITLLISILNFKRGTFLIGFDSLHNEFDLLLNLKRDFFGVWQTHQGLGLLGGMSHLSDIPRMLILLLLSVFFPVNVLRYIWTFLMLVLGPLGVYFFSCELMNDKKSSYKGPIAFLSALFYLFNLSTVQLFYSNFDGFVTHYGFIPWLFMSSYLFITRGHKKHLIWFLILSVVSSNQAYTGTLFFAFALFLSVFLFLTFLQNKINIPVKRLLIFITLWVGINLFWILPVGYFIKSSAGVIYNTSVNLMSSEESYFMNKRYGTLKDVLTLKNFWFELNDYDVTTDSFIPLLSPWINYLKGKEIILYTLSSFVVIGFIFSLIIKRHRPFSILFLMSVFFLMAGNGAFGSIFTFLQSSIPLFREALRFPFTKFSVLASFTYSIMVLIFFEKIFDIVQGKLKNYLPILVSFVFSITLILAYLPFFRGQLFNPRMRITVPKEYFDMYKFFDSQPSDGRVYLMPSNTFWAWEYYNWGYRGSGFIWYGMKQPVLDRAFDVWNSQNEKVYWEMSRAFSLKNVDILKSVIEKYNIQWFIYDGSRIYPKNEPIKKYSYEVKKFLDELLAQGDTIKESYKFGFLDVYRTSVTQGFFGYSSSDIPTVATFDGLSHYDSAYFQLGNYISRGVSVAKVIFPYSQLLGVRSININPDYSIPSFYKNSTPINNGGVNYAISYNGYISTGNLGINVVFNPTIYDTLPDNKHVIQGNIKLENGDSVIFLNNHFRGKDLIEKGSVGFLVSEEQQDSSFKIYRPVRKSGLEDLISSGLDLSTCSDSELGSYSVEYKGKSFFLKSSKENSSVCVSAGLVTSSDEGYIRVLNFDFDLKNSVGRVCLFNNDKKKCDFSENLFNSGSYSIPLINLNKGNNYSIYFYGYLSSEFSELPESFEVDFSNIYFEDKKLIYNEDIKVPAIRSDLAVGDTILDTSNPDDKSLNYKGEVLPGLFRSCEEVDRKIDFTKKADGLTFNILGEKDVCLTILNDSMLPALPFSGVVEIEYGVSGKSQNVYAINNNLFEGVDKFKADGVSNKISFPIYHANSLSINVELTSSGQGENYFKVKSVRVIPFDVKSVASSKISVGDIDLNKFPFSNLNYKGVPFMYKVENVRDGYIGFHQSYSKDWLMLCPNFKCKTNHEKMNNWENIWSLRGSPSTIYVVFAPQILGFMGCILSILSLICAAFLIYRRR